MLNWYGGAVLVPSPLGSMLSQIHGVVEDSADDQHLAIATTDEEVSRAADPTPRERARLWTSARRTRPLPAQAGVYALPCRCVKQRRE